MKTFWCRSWMLRRSVCSCACSSGGGTGLGWQRSAIQRPPTWRQPWPLLWPQALRAPQMPSHLKVSPFTVPIGSLLDVRAVQHQVDDVIELGRTPSWMSSYLTLRRLTPKVLTCMQADPHQQRRSHCQLAACRSACTTHRLARSLFRSLER